MDTNPDDLQAILAVLKAAGVARFTCPAFSVEFPAAQPPIVGSTRFVPASPAAPHGQVSGSPERPGYRELFGDNMPVFPTSSVQGS